MRTQKTSPILNEFLKEKYAACPVHSAHQSIESNRPRMESASRQCRVVQGLRTQVQDEIDEKLQSVQLSKVQV